MRVSNPIQSNPIQFSSVQFSSVQAMIAACEFCSIIKKLEDIVGLYPDTSVHALVLCCNENEDSGT